MSTLRTARVLVHRGFVVGDIDRRLFGSFVEHMGRCVYTGIFEPDHLQATAEGFRRDVLDLTTELGVSVVRYPGGNFVSGYRWEDGVGPVAQRPTRLDLAWRSIEPNRFGLHEFMAWTRRAGVAPMLAVNLGTRGVQEAADLVEYCNHPGGTALSDLRRENDTGIGDGSPFGVRLWCLGNEMDGPWQTGQKKADEYGRLAAETAKAMRLVDRDIELVVCGSSNRSMPTFGAWESAVLDATHELVDYISLHAYYEQQGEDLDSFLACAVDMDGFIDDVISTADAVAARKHSAKRVRLSFDEWNVWNQRDFPGADALDYTHAPRLIEDTYRGVDAVVVATFLMSLLRHCDRVAVACLAQLVNIIGPIRTEPGGPAWRQAIFHPFAHTARLARGQVLRSSVTSAPEHGTDRFGVVPTLDALVTHDASVGDVVAFLVNRSSDETLPVEVQVQGFGALQLAEHVTLSGASDAVNTEEAPDEVAACPGDNARVDGEVLRVALPPASWHAIRLAPVPR